MYCLWGEFGSYPAGLKQSVPASLTVYLPPRDIWVSPHSFDVNVFEGTSLTTNMVIGNDGNVPFDYQIRARSVSAASLAAERLDKIAAASKKYDIFRVPKGRDFSVVDDNKPYNEGELLVRFADTSTNDYIATQTKNKILKSAGGGSVKKSFKIVPGLSLVHLPEGLTVKQALKQFNKTNGILYAQPNYEVQITSTIPNDSRFSELWGMHNTGQNGGTPGADIDAARAWDFATGSRQIVVAVIDTGVDYTHPDLAPNMWVNPGEIPGNGIDDDGNGYIDDVYGYDFYNDDGNPMDDHYHGTHCAGTIGAVGNNGQGVAGVCWNVKIMAIKFLNSNGSGTTEGAVSAIEYSILMGAKLSSNSWGSDSDDPALKDAINAAGAAGMLFISAAGNYGSNNDIYPFYPASYDCPSLVAVAATDRYDNRSSFSNYGLTSVDLGAPGSDILSCQPGNSYQYLNGTSMATPHVAGASALIWSINPMLTSNEVKDILLRSVDKIPSLNGKCVSQGRLNLYKAVLETKVKWIHLNPEAGTVEPNQTDNITVVFDANDLESGIYEAEIVIISNDPCHPQLIVPVTLTVKLDDLRVSPADNFQPYGTIRGPFEPNFMKYTLTNIGLVNVDWTVSRDANWLAITPTFGILEPNHTVDVNVSLSPQAYLLDPNIYTGLIKFKNINTGSVKKRTAALTAKPPDCFTELFEERSNVQSKLMLTFAPNGSVAYYEACRNTIDQFPTSPNGGIFVPLWDDDYAEIILENNAQVLFYGHWYDRFYIGSNGYITFGQPSAENLPTLQNHFAIPRISALFTDLNPSSEYDVSYKQLADRIVVTFQDIPLYGDKNAKSSFQIEMFFVTGQIRITWLDIASATAVAGLSQGKGMPVVLFEQSDLSDYPLCWPLGDLNKDYSVDFKDMALFALHWCDVNCCLPFWCDKTDLNFNSYVNAADLQILSNNWLTIIINLPQPISYWKFDEGQGSIAFDSIGGNDGSIYEAVWTTGKVNGALNFDGYNDYVDVGNNNSLEPQSFTLTFWSQNNHPEQSFKGGIGKGKVFGSTNEFSYKIDFHQGFARAWVSNVSNTAYGVFTPITDTAWHMWSMTVGAGILSIYKDGIVQQGTTYSGTIDYNKDYNEFSTTCTPLGPCAMERRL